MSAQTLDQVILVNSQDQELGVMDKVEAHRGQARLHRASSVFLFNRQGELLLQQRSVHKIVGALQWANTCCGNVRPEESYEQCARRRLSEELRITQVEIKPIHKFEYAVACNQEFSEHEMDQVFVGNYEGVVRPNQGEVISTRWASIAEIKEDMMSNQKIYTPWFILMLEKSVFSRK